MASNRIKNFRYANEKYLSNLKYRKYKKIGVDKNNKPIFSNIKVK